MFIKNVTLKNGKCILTFRDANWKISIPASDDPGFCPNDELIITDTRIFKIVRLYVADSESESWNDTDTLMD